MRFHKYYANGNDFIIALADENWADFIKNKDKKEFIKWICNRHKGVGADGFILVVPNSFYRLNKQLKFDKKQLKFKQNNDENDMENTQKCDFIWEFYNLDGSAANMCGNGSRAAAHFAYENGICDNKMTFLTGAGTIKANIENDGVKVCLGKLKSAPKEIEFEGEKYYFVDSGVPHIVKFADVDSFDIKLCKKLRNTFDANVNYAQIISKNELKVRTYERGVEMETLACGTGMGASFYFAMRFGLEKKAKVYPSSLEEVEFCYDNEELYFKGKVNKSFEVEF